jgi:hypothetical protein
MKSAGPGRDMPKFAFDDYRQARRLRAKLS